MLKKLSVSSIAVAVLFLSGCSSVNVLQPTPEEAAKVAQHKLTDVPSQQEALIYAINWSSNEKQRIRPLYVKVGEQAKVVEAGQYTVFRVKPEAFNITVTGLCGLVTATDLKAGLEKVPPTFSTRDIQESHYGGEGGKTYRKADAKKFVAEAGKSYFLWLETGCFINRYAGEVTMYSHINTVGEEQGRYLTFKTKRAAE